MGAYRYCRVWRGCTHFRHFVFLGQFRRDFAYLTVPGDIEPIPLEFRTSHRIENGKPVLPRPHRKQLKWKKERHPISSADIGGQDQFKNLWIDDMFSREVNLVFFMVDERVLTHPQFTLEAVASLQYLIDRV